MSGCSTLASALYTGSARVGGTLAKSATAHWAGATVGSVRGGGGAWPVAP